MLRAVEDGEPDPTMLAALATREQLRDAFGACADLHPVKETFDPGSSVPQKASTLGPIAGYVRLSAHLCVRADGRAFVTSRE